ncbi:hypothetical protein ACSQ67_013221 [Phaseolus vulgaris]
MRLKRVVKSLTNKHFLHQTAAATLHPQRRPSPPTHPPPTTTSLLLGLSLRIPLQPHPPIPCLPPRFSRRQDPRLLQRPPLPPQQHRPLHHQPRHPSNQTGSYHNTFALPLRWIRFSPLADDYKIVRISTCVSAYDDQVVVLDNIRVNRAEVYSLTSGSWREIDAAKLQPLCPVSSSVTITGTIFWLASMTSASDTDSEFVLSFDVGREWFTLVNGPPIPSSPSHPYSNNVLAVYNDELAMFRNYIVGNFESCSFDLWVLKDFNGDYDNDRCDGGGESWVKMYRVGPFSRIMYPLSIWKDEIVCREELCAQENDFRGVQTVLSLFNPVSMELKKLPAHRDELCYVPFTYAESLVPV